MLCECFAEAISVGKILVNRLTHPPTESAGIIDVQSAVEEFEKLLAAVKCRERDIDVSIAQFKQTLEESLSTEPNHPTEKYIISETPLFVEVEVFEEETPVSFANDKVDGMENDEGSNKELGVRPG